MPPGGASPVTGVSHVSINVSDLDRSREFYRDAFGWHQVFETELDSEALTRLVGVPGASGRVSGGLIGDLKVELMCLSYTPRSRPRPGLGLQVLSFEVPDAAAACARARERGIPVVSDPVEIHGTRMFFVVDPDGQAIEMVEYLPGQSGWERGGGP
jgi:catechol 2,3-dioxygenase-like lactoylglutathione lyase family enzyme